MMVRVGVIFQELVYKSKLKSSLNVGKIFEIIFEENIVTEEDGMMFMKQLNYM